MSISMLLLSTHHKVRFTSCEITRTKCLYEISSIFTTGAAENDSVEGRLLFSTEYFF